MTITRIMRCIPGLTRGWIVSNVTAGLVNILDINGNIVEQIVLAAGVAQRVEFILPRQTCRFTFQNTGGVNTGLFCSVNTLENV